MDIWLAGQGGDGIMCMRHIWYASIWALAILDGDCAEFHPLPQTPPLFSSKANGGQLPYCTVSCFLWVDGNSYWEPPFHNGASTGEDGGRGRAKCPPCAWSRPFMLWFIPLPSANGRWSVCVFQTGIDSLCWQCPHFPLLHPPLLKYSKQCLCGK